MIKLMGEKSKISIRNIRRDANDELKKKLKSKEISEDDEKKFEKNVQNITDEHVKKIEEISGKFWILLAKICGELGNPSPENEMDLFIVIRLIFLFQKHQLIFLFLHEFH